MKNFYEATVTKPTLTSTIELLLTPIEQCVCVVLINGHVMHDGLLTKSKKVTFQNNPIDETIDIKIIVTRQHPEAVEVKVAIDGYEIIPMYQDTVAIPATNYLNFNGEWNVRIPNFYAWHHGITGQGWIA